MMQSSELEQPLRLYGLPRLDRFFPSCFLSLVELVARAKFGYPDIKKCWFGNTFAYYPPATGELLTPNGNDLAGIINVADDPNNRALERLDYYYGISVQRVPVHSFEDLLRRVTESIRAGMPCITCYDMAFLDDQRLANPVFRPHKVAVVGSDPSQGRMWIVDQVRGEIEIALDDLAASFERFANHGVEFSILSCDCAWPRRGKPFDRGSVTADLTRSLENLWSTDPNLGLNALRHLSEDVARAYEAAQRPFWVWELWIFSHDRHCLRKALPYWRDAVPSMAGMLEKLDAQLSQAFDLWFEVEVMINRCTLENNVQGMGRVAPSLDRIIEAEQAIGEALQGMLAHIQTSKS